MKNIRDVLIHGHRQAFAWIDEWFSKYIYGVTLHLYSIIIYVVLLMSKSNKHFLLPIII